jgi:hypothetical protein
MTRAENISLMRREVLPLPVGSTCRKGLGQNVSSTDEIGIALVIAAI